MMNTHANRMTARRASGFSLVEVLIAIFVLALGLLGVAAVFPAVVRQQRTATDAVQGISIQRSVEELLRGHALLSEPNVYSRDNAGNQTVSPRGWAMLAGDPGFSSAGAWAAANEVATGTASESGITLDTRTGTMYVGADGLMPGFAAIEIPLAERLIPRPSESGSVQPRFVWDFIARRVAAGEKPVGAVGASSNFTRLDDDTIQLAVFVRRIDSGIRVPGDSTLGGVLTSPNRRVVPVAEDTAGRPTFDGVGRGAEPRYSPIRSTTVTAVVSNGRPQTNIITTDQSAAFSPLRPYLEQLGQKFIDAKGMVHEVVRLNRDVTPVQLTIDPPFASGLVVDAGGATLAPEIRFTSQVPASVSVVTIRR
ncbi:MAG: prepilin-type N-terminal cleavage/methylation domain-containing protein [Phycisphaerae bacterium]|jgi:type IV pilus assembly protein PilV